MVIKLVDRNASTELPEISKTNFIITNYFVIGTLFDNQIPVKAAGEAPAGIVG